MANTGGERITNTFRFKHHAISVPEITATNRIIDATERLTAIIAGTTVPSTIVPCKNRGISLGPRLREILVTVVTCI